MSDGEGGTEFVYSNDAGTVGVVETQVEADGTPGESHVVVSTGNAGEPAEAANDNGGGYVDPMNH